MKTFFRKLHHLSGTQVQWILMSMTAKILQFNANQKASMLQDNTGAMDRQWAEAFFLHTVNRNLL